MRLVPDRYPVIGQHSPIGAFTAALFQPDNHVTLEFMARALPKDRTTYRVSGVNRPYYNIC